MNEQRTATSYMSNAFAFALALAHTILKWHCRCAASSPIQLFYLLFDIESCLKLIVWILFGFDF